MLLPCQCYSYAISTALELELLTLQHIEASSMRSLPILQRPTASYTVSFLRIEHRVSISSLLPQVIRI
jgi:hypothetical protein